MKILVCADGSEQSIKALEEAAKIATGCVVSEVAVIHVYDHRQDLSTFAANGTYTASDVEKYRSMVENHKEERRKILEDAVKMLETQNIKARAIFKEGHPSQTIINVACEEEFDMIVIGSRGLSGLQKLFLGSVSTAVVQQAKNSNVLTVKK